MKRICFVVTLSMTIKSFLLDLASNLIEQGEYDVTFICDNDPGLYELLTPGMHYTPIAMKRGISLSGIKTIYELFKIFKKEQFDIVQYSTPNAAFYASIAAKKAHIRNRLYCQWGIRYMGFDGGFARCVFKLIEKITCKYSTIVESESHSLYQFSINEKLYAPSKASVMWNGSACGVNFEKYDISKGNEWRAKIRKEIGIDDIEIVIGYARRITRDKGINELWQAFRNLRPDYNCRLLLIGNIDDVSSLNPELLDWSQHDPHVTYVQWTGRTEEYYAAMDVFVSPSYREGFGLVVIEAGAMGVPAIVSDVPGQVDTVVPNVTGIICEVKNPISLQKAMETLIQNPRLRKIMGKQAAIHVRENYDQKQLFDYIKNARDHLLD
jgi:glycosyltransferase involved in cell wall biosynthesis